MFARWQNTRIKAARRALDDGRIDDAFAVATEAAVLADRNAQDLLNDLARALLARARLHAQAGRYTDAMTDLDRLSVLGRQDDDARELAGRVREHLGAEIAAKIEKQDAYRRAAEDVRAGHLESGRVHIERVIDVRQRAELERELGDRERRTSEMLRQAITAFDRGDLLAAVRLWQDAVRRHGQTHETDAFAIRCASALKTFVTRAFEDGALARAMAARAALEAVRKHEPSIAEQEQLLRLAEQAATQLAGRDYVSLRQSLLRMKAVAGEPRWLAAALEAGSKAVESLDVLLASPLGAALHESAALPVAAQPSLRDAVDVREFTAPKALGEKAAMLLLIDGSGSALLLRKSLVKIGRLGGGADVPFPFDVQSSHAEIERDGEDYFLTAYGPAFVNQRRVTRTLLRDGDRVLLGARAKFVFAKPSSKSATAVLRLSNSSRLPQDVSDVVLFCDTCLIGAAPSCHVRTREGDSQVVLFDRGGELQARVQTAARGSAGETRALQGGTTNEVGDLRLTAKPYDPRGPRTT